MKIFKVFSLSGLFVFILGFRSNNLPPVFLDRLNRAHMSFEAPKGFIEMPLVKNGQMHYEYALKDTTRDLEIRYAIAPLDSIFIQFNQMEKAGSHMVIGPNKLYYGAFLSTMSNISNGDRRPQIGAFPAQAVKEEFNADWGGSGFCDPGGEFGKGYKYCLGVALHKDSLADAYYFYLTNNMANFSQTSLIPVFHAMKFK